MGCVNNKEQIVDEYKKEKKCQTSKSLENSKSESINASISPLPMMDQLYNRRHLEIQRIFRDAYYLQTINQPDFHLKWDDIYYDSISYYEPHATSLLPVMSLSADN
jgi:hypothetical protein